MLFPLFALALAVVAEGKNFAGFYSHFLNIQQDGSVYVFGTNDFGELGINSLNAAPHPAKMHNTQNVTDVAAGRTFSCVVDNGAARCTGSNNGRSLGTTTENSTSLVLVQVDDLDQNVSQVFCGPTQACALLNEGGLWCWGKNIVPTSMVGYETEGVLEVAMGDEHLCIVTVDGHLRCAGKGSNGALGTGEYNYAGVLTPVVGLGSGGGFVSVACGSGHSCAVHGASGGVICWGRNLEAQLMISPFVQDMFYNEPQQTVLSSGVRAVWVLSHATFAILSSNNSIISAGFNDHGNIGSGNKSENPRIVPGFFAEGVTGIREVRGGDVNTCVLFLDDTVQCIDGDYSDPSNPSGLYSIALPATAQPSAHPSTAPSTRPTLKPTPPTAQPSARPSAAPVPRPSTLAPSTSGGSGEAAASLRLLALAVMLVAMLQSF